MRQLKFIWNCYFIKTERLKEFLKTCKKKKKNLLTREVKPSTFMFSDVYYKQVDGVAIGQSWDLI